MQYFRSLQGEKDDVYDYTEQICNHKETIETFLITLIEFSPTEHTHIHAIFLIFEELRKTTVIKKYKINFYKCGIHNQR